MPTRAEVIADWRGRLEAAEQELSVLMADEQSTKAELIGAVLLVRLVKANLDLALMPLTTRVYPPTSGSNVIQFRPREVFI